MYLVDAGASEHRSPRFGIWFRAMIRRHLLTKDPHRTCSRLDRLDGLPGPMGSTYRQRRAQELERAWQNGEISYQNACDEMEELDGEP
ncbi:hypothetical protein [Arthrobacter sp. UYEF20]|uniref:hypothetical protein n=1 Tax=Arthrobacter sp. UYEF20 TaxID=1756363 RepID=UPI0033934205